MLKTISCAEFKIGIAPRPPVNFHAGLNTILGSTRGQAGSIGKSTFLLIIDFAFGGQSYLKSDALSELGHHGIYFVFEFDGIDYHFLRPTNEPEKVLLVDEKHNILDTWKRSDFTSWLSKRYGMDFPSLSFRNTISRYFRIYGKNNYNELRPLQVRSGEESQRDAINVLITLFNEHQSISVFAKQLHDAEDRIRAFREARRYEFIPSSVDKRQKYNANITEISTLRYKRQQLIVSAENDLDEADVKNASEWNAMRRRLEDIRRLIRDRKDELHLIELNLQCGAYPTEADLKALLTFFPNANLKQLIDIEKFHTKIQVILNRELEEAKTTAENDLARLEGDETEVLSQMKLKPTPRALTDEFLEAFTALDRRISKLQDENTAFETNEQLQIEKIDAKSRYEKQIECVLTKLQRAINEQMEEINRFVTGGELNPPHLTIAAHNKYQFETPKDTGTGTNHRSMIIFDLAILRCTALPAIGHDSIMFDSVARPELSKLISFYARQRDKQVFIAVDKTSDLSHEAQEIIRTTTVLKLDDDESALFGRKWSRKQSD